MICPECSHDNPAELLTCPNCQARQYLAKLRVTLDNGRSTTHYLFPKKYTIGRAPESDITIADISVSRNHAVIEFETERFWIRDLDSKNGSLLNGQVFQRNILTDADCFQLGDILLYYYDERNKLPTPVAGMKTEQFVQHELTRLVENRQTRASTIDVLLTTLDLMLSLTHAGIGLIFQYNHNSEFEIKYGRNSHGHAVTNYHLSKENWHFIHSALKERSLKIEFCEPADNTAEAKTGGRTWKQMVLPLETGETESATKANIGKDGMIGFCLLTRAQREQTWSDTNLVLLHALARQMTSVLESDMLYHEAEQKQDISNELSMAREIQERFQHTALPHIAELDVARHLKPCKMISGDYIDIIALSETLVAIAIGDVCGKGVPAALLSSTTLAAIRSQLEFTKSPDEIITNLNRLFIKSTAESMFLTLFFGILDLASGVLTYVNAGHPPAIVLTPDLGMKELEGTTFALGIMEGESGQERRIEFVSGDMLILYTDGVIESRNPDKDIYGRERLKITIQNFVKAEERHKGNFDLHQLIHAINTDVEKFQNGYNQEDDISILIIKWL